MKYNFDNIVERRGTDCLKWDFVKERFGAFDLLPMWVADMDFLAPEEVIRAIEKRLEHGVLGYTGRGKSYYESIINWVLKRHGWKIETEWIQNNPGVVSSLAISILAFTNPGDKILIQTPVYPPFFGVIESNGREIVKSSLIASDCGYEMDFDDIEKKFQSGVKMMLLCNPHNPIGRVFTSNELLRLGELCKRYNVMIVSDEIHSDIIFENNKHVPIASLSKEFADFTVTCIAPSKTFNVAGLSASIAIIPNKTLMERFTNTMLGLGIDGSNLIGGVALEACYSYGEEWLEELLKYLKENRDFALDFIESRIPQIKAIKSQGTYLMWLDCRGLGMENAELNKFMIEKAKVALNDGSTFGEEGKGFLRLNIGCPRSILEQGLERIENAIKKK